MGFKEYLGLTLIYCVYTQQIPLHDRGGEYDYPGNCI
jgi:hypothetical protein